MPRALVVDPVSGNDRIERRQRPISAGVDRRVAVVGPEVEVELVGRMPPGPPRLRSTRVPLVLKSAAVVAERSGLRDGRNRRRRRTPAPVNRAGRRPGGRSGSPKRRFPKHALHQKVAALRQLR